MIDQAVINVYLQRAYLGNTIMDYLVSILILIIGLIAVRVIKRILFRKIKNWAKKTKTSIDDFIIRLMERLIFPVADFGVFLLAINYLDLNPMLQKGMDILGAVLVVFVGVRFAVLIIEHMFNAYWRKKGQGDLSLKNSLTAITRVIKVILWGIGIVFLLDNIGFKVSAVIAGLGIGGVAIAFASQKILEDVFSYVCILFDRPFTVGDFIILNDLLGVVEHIGIKTTRITSLGGEQLIIANSDLGNARLRNYKQMEKRRVVFKLGVTYETPLEKLKEIPGIIKGVIEKITDIKFDRAHFLSFDNFCLTIEVVYYVFGSDYNKYMDVQQEINLNIFKEFNAWGIEFAYPTQTLYLNKVQNSVNRGGQTL